MGRRVAINAQVNPSFPGGVETNVVSLLSYMAREATDLHATALALDKPKVVEAVRQIVGPQVRVEQWRLGQDGVPRGTRLARFGWLRDAMGPWAFEFDTIVRNYRSLKYQAPKPATAREIDSELDKLDVGIVHFPYPQYFQTKRPFIYEPWDLQYLHYPDFFTKDEVEWRDRAYRKGCGAATHIVTATEWVKNDIVERYGVSPNKITAIPRDSCIVSTPLTEERRIELLDRAKVERDFIFYPAMSFQHKNHIRLLQALRLLRDRGRSPIQLVLSGRIHQPFWPAVEAEIKRLGLERQVVVLGPVSDEVLTALFRSARFMIFPSLFEGLGLPLLEAFRNRLPVVAANETCIPEVVGDGAMLFNGRDVDAIAAAIADALDDPERLEALKSEGLKRLELFSWRRAGPAFVSCYKRLLGEAVAVE